MSGNAVTDDTEAHDPVITVVEAGGVVGDVELENKFEQPAFSRRTAQTGNHKTRLMLRLSAGRYNLCMSILKVARMGHPVLRAKAAPVPTGDIRTPRIQQLIDDMFETMREYTGIGLAAPQVHEGLRLFVAGLHRSEAPPTELSDDTDMPLIALINPQITMVGERVHEGWEGCLSIPDIRGLVPRALEIRVEAHDRTGRRLQFAARGLPARVIQHETDHLDGVLFFDRMRSLETLTFMEEYQRFRRKDDDE